MGIVQEDDWMFARDPVCCTVATLRGDEPLFVLQ